MARGSALNRFIDRYVGIPIAFMLGLVRRKKDLPPVQEKVLVVLFGALGDTVLLLPLLHELHVTRNVKILFLCSRENASLLSGIPFIDVLVFDLSKLFTLPFHVLRARRRISAFSPHVLIDFNPWARISGIVGWFVFDGWTIGFRTSKQARHFVYDAAVEHGPLQHEQRNYQALARAVFPGLAPGTGFRLPLSEADRNSSFATLERYGVKPGSFVVFHPWSGGYLREQKEWSQEKSIQFMRELDKAGIQVCVTGTGSDQPFAAAFPWADDRLVSLVGRLSVGELLWILSLARAVVSVNTGIMHLAASLDVPLFVLDGPAGADRWGPVSGAYTRVFTSTFPCSPCLNLGFEYPCQGKLKCMETIDPVQVAREVVEYCRSPRALSV